MLRSREQSSRRSRQRTPLSSFAKTTILVGLVGLVMLSVQPWHANAPHGPNQLATDHALVDAGATRQSAAGAMPADAPAQASFTVRFNEYGESLGAQ